MKEYAFTETTLPETPVKTVTGTYDATWKDKLLTWDGTAMTYDAIGNMLTKGSTTFSWQGRKLTGVENGKSIQYSYDHAGARTKKVVDSVITEYRMAGDLLVSEKIKDPARSSTASPCSARSSARPIPMMRTEISSAWWMPRRRLRSLSTTAPTT